MKLYLDEIEPRPGALTSMTVYRRLVPGRLLVGHVAMQVYPVDHGREYVGTPESSEVGKVSGATWTCPCGAQSRKLWSRTSWARAARIGHWNRTHSGQAVARRGAS